MSIVERLTFMAGCMARVPFREQVEAAATAGFDSITSWPNIWRHALVKDGMTLADMRALLDDHGLELTDCDACKDWVPDTGRGSPGPRMSGSRHEFFEVCSALGGSTIVAVHGTGAPFVLDRDAEAFAQLCDDALEHGLRIALEFVPFMGVPDVATAWSLLSTADRPNSGLVFDNWHHVRSGRDDDALRAVSPDRIFTVQLSDGPLDPASDLAHEAMYERSLPGTGLMDVAATVKVLESMGVRASVGPELNVAAFAGSAKDVARQLAVSTREVLGMSTTPRGHEPS